MAGTVNPCLVWFDPKLRSQIKDSMNTKDIGNLGEHIAIVELLKHGIGISRPLGDNSRYDLVLDIANTLFTCQVKSTNVSSTELAEFWLTSSAAHRGGTRTPYTVDLFCLVDIPNNNVFLFENTKNQGSIKLRYGHTLTSSSNSANDFTIQKYLSRLPT